MSDRVGRITQLSDKPKPLRLNIELGPDSARFLVELQKRLETTSKVDAIRIALVTLHKLVDELADGGRLVVIHRDGIGTTEILLPNKKGEPPLDDSPTAPLV